MKTSCLILTSAVLLLACDPPSDNVGEIPTESESDTDPMGTQTGTTTGGESQTGPGGTETSATEGTETGGTETGTETDSNEACLDVSYECFFDEYEPLECGGMPMCDVLEINDPDLNEFDEEPFGFVNPEAATCILESLGAGIVGEYRIEVEPGQQYSRSFRFETLSDGSVIFRSAYQEDKGCDGRDMRGELLDADFFAGCQALEDDLMILECMLGGVANGACEGYGLTCPE